MTELIRRKIVGDAWETVVDSGGGGGNTVEWLSFPFSFDTPGLADGVEFYTPTIGEMVTIVAVSVLTAWDGTTPTGGFGVGLGDIWMGNGGKLIHAADMTQADSASASVALPSNATSYVAFVLTDDPVKFWVTQDGDPGGADPGASQGECVVHLVVILP